MKYFIEWLQATGFAFAAMLLMMPWEHGVAMERAIMMPLMFGGISFMLGKRFLINTIKSVKNEN